MHRIQLVEVFVFKYNHHYRLGGHTDAPGRLPGTNYYFEPQWKQVYSRLTESCLVKIVTDTGITGWGEAQAPIVPEMPATLIEKLFGPAILGRNAEDTEAIYDLLYGFNQVRGHTASFTIDAITAIDIALWDIKGKIAAKPVSQLLNVQAKNSLPLYVSGLRRPDADSRRELAAQVVREGYRGVKMFSGLPPGQVLAECVAIRQAIGEQAFMAFDAIGAYSFEDALQIGKGLDELHADWFEAPIDPEDINGHARLAAALKTPIAIGEPLRTVREFEPWLQQNAMQVLQPDIVRCGITGGRRINRLATHRQYAVTPHIGVCTAVGVAATWHFAAALPGELVQEHQLDLLVLGNRVLNEPLEVQNGTAVVPAAAGLGITVNEDFIRANSADTRLVTANGAVV